MSASTTFGIHNVSADDTTAGPGSDVGLYVSKTDGRISFNLGRVDVFFDNAADFAGWLTKLNELAANTLCVVEAQEAGRIVPDAALADYDRYRDTLAVFDADAAPATFGEWWARYADDYEAKQ